MKPAPRALRLVYLARGYAPFTDGPLAIVARDLCAALADAGALVLAVARADSEPAGLAHQLTMEPPRPGGNTMYGGASQDGRARLAFLVGERDPSGAELGRWLSDYFERFHDCVDAVCLGRSTEALEPTRVEAVVRERDLGFFPGIDQAAFGPHAEDLREPGDARRAVRRRLGLDPSERAPLFVAVGARDSSMWSDDIDAELDRAGAHLAIDDPSLPVEPRRELYAAADFALLTHRAPEVGPSDLAPARFGAIPIAPRDGRYDTVLADADLAGHRGTAFLHAPAAAHVVSAVRDALAAYEHPGFDALARRASELDLGWSRPAALVLEAAAARLR